MAPGLVEIALVIFFCAIKGRCRGKLCYHWACESVFFIELCDTFFGRRFLLVIVIKDGGAILAAHIRALTVKRGWIVEVEKDVQQVFIGDPVGVKGQMDGFGMTGGIAANFAVGGVVRMPAGVAYFGINNTVLFAKACFYTPEATGGESG